MVDTQDFSYKQGSAKQRKQRALSWTLKRVTGARVFLPVESTEELTQALKFYELSRSQLEIVLRRNLKNI